MMLVTSEAIEAGAEDVITDDEGAIEVLTAPAEFETVRDALQALCVPAISFLLAAASVLDRPANRRPRR